MSVLVHQSTINPSKYFWSEGADNGSEPILGVYFKDLPDAGDAGVQIDSATFDAKDDGTLIVNTFASVSYLHPYTPTQTSLGLSEVLVSYYKDSQVNYLNSVAGADSSIAIPDIPGRTYYNTSFKQLLIPVLKGEQVQVSFQTTGQSFAGASWSLVFYPS